MKSVLQRVAEAIEVISNRLSLLEAEDTKLLMPVDPWVISTLKSQLLAFFIVMKMVYAAECSIAKGTDPTTFYDIFKDAQRMVEEFEEING